MPDDRLGEIYAQADIFAMTSMPHRLSVEGFGLVYLEAGAHGLPVVAHAIGGVPEAVLDGQISEGHAKALLGIEGRQGQTELGRRIMRERLTVRATARDRRPLTSSSLCTWGCGCSKKPRPKSTLRVSKACVIWSW